MSYHGTKCMWRHVIASLSCGSITSSCDGSIRHIVIWKHHNMMWRHHAISCDDTLASHEGMHHSMMRYDNIGTSYEGIVASHMTTSQHDVMTAGRMYQQTPSSCRVFVADRSTRANKVFCRHVEGNDTQQTPRGQQRQVADTSGKQRQTSETSRQHRHSLNTSGATTTRCRHVGDSNDTSTRS